MEHRLAEGWLPHIKYERRNREEGRRIEFPSSVRVTLVKANSDNQRIPSHLVSVAHNYSYCYSNCPL